MVHYIIRKERKVNKMKKNVNPNNEDNEREEQNEQSFIKNSLKKVVDQIKELSKVNHEESMIKSYKDELLEDYIDNSDDVITEEQEMLLNDFAQYIFDNLMYKYDQALKLMEGGKSSIGMCEQCFCGNSDLGCNEMCIMMNEALEDPDHWYKEEWRHGNKE